MSEFLLNSYKKITHVCLPFDSLKRICVFLNSHKHADILLTVSCYSDKGCNSRIVKLNYENFTEIFSDITPKNVVNFFKITLGREFSYYLERDFVPYSFVITFQSFNLRLHKCLLSNYILQTYVF